MDLKIIITLVTVIVVLSLTWFSFSNTATNDISSEIILETNTIVPSNIKYPSDYAKITSKIITIPVGGETVYHTNEYPLFAYIMEGKVSVEHYVMSYDPHTITKEFHKGDSFVEPAYFFVNKINTGDTPAKILVVIMGMTDYDVYDDNVYVEGNRIEH